MTIQFAIALAVPELLQAPAKTNTSMIKTLNMLHAVHIRSVAKSPHDP
jgi:hypothetical protein